MCVFLKSYVKFFTSVTEEDCPMLECVKSFVSLADRVRCFEKLFMEFNCHFAGCEGCEGLLSAISNHTDEMNSYPAEFRVQTLHFFELNLGQDCLLCKNYKHLKGRKRLRISLERLMFFFIVRLRSETIPSANSS